MLLSRKVRCYTAAAMAKPRVFMDITAGGNPLGRIVMEVNLESAMVVWPADRPIWKCSDVECV